MPPRGQMLAALAHVIDALGGQAAQSLHVEHRDTAVAPLDEAGLG